MVAVAVTCCQTPSSSCTKSQVGLAASSKSQEKVEESASCEARLAGSWWDAGSGAASSGLAGKGLWAYSPPLSTAPATAVYRSSAMLWTQLESTSFNLILDKLKTQSLSGIHLMKFYLRFEDRPPSLDHMACVVWISMKISINYYPSPVISVVSSEL